MQWKGKVQYLLDALGDDCDPVVHEVPDEDLRGRLAVLGRDLLHGGVLHQVAQGVSGGDHATCREKKTSKTCEL